MYDVFEGKPYPVVEFPNESEPNSLCGKQCKTGFNSHYVTVRKNQGDYIPCNPEEVDPEFDEIIIFNPDQILPRYLVYYSIQSADSPTTRHILWVHSPPDGEEITNLKQEIEKKGAIVLTFSTSVELMKWLSASKGEDIRIISSKFRKDDGGESAGVRLCQWLQQEYSNIPFMLFCEDGTLVKDLPKGEHIHLAKKGKHLIEFALH